MLAGTKSQASRSGKDKEISLCREEEAPRGSKCCPKCRRQKRGTCSERIKPSCIMWGVTKKNEAREESTATSKKRLGQCAPGELVKNTLPWPISGQLSLNIRVGYVGICVSCWLPGWVTHTHWSLRTSGLERLCLWNSKEWHQIRERRGTGSGGHLRATVSALFLFSLGSGFRL